MANFAEMNSDNIVVRVLVTDNNDPAGDEGHSFLVDTFGGTWIQTSYNTIGNKHTLNGTPLHKNYAGIGYTWDGTGFAAPQPFPSWTLNSDSYLWEAPTPMPTDNKHYTWDESTTSWIEA